MLKPPANEEYPAYYETYLCLVPEGSLPDILTQQMEATIALFSNVSDRQANDRYALGKWTLKEVIGHLTDTERIMSYRLLRIARGDETPLAGYDDEPYVKEAGFASRLLSDLIADYRAVRLSTLSLVRGIPVEAWPRTGFANDSKFSARALAYVIAGHELHHIKICKEKYLTRG